MLRSGRTGMRIVIAASIAPEGPGSKLSPGPSRRSRDPLQELDLVEGAAEAEDHARGRIRGDLHRELRLLAEEPVEPAQERAAARENDAGVDDIRGQLRGRPLQARADRLDDGRDALAKSLADLFLVEHDRFRNAVREVPPLDLQREGLGLAGVGRSELDLELLGLALADE